MYAGVITGVQKDGVQVSVNGRRYFYKTRRKFRIGNRVWAKFDGARRTISDLQHASETDELYDKDKTVGDDICWDGGCASDWDGIAD